MAQQTDDNKMKSTQSVTNIHTLTAVEFLLIELDIAKLIAREKLTIAAEIVRQAKQMEKEQIIDAFEIGWKDEDRIGLEYYNETYNK